MKRMIVGGLVLIVLISIAWLLFLLATLVGERFGPGIGFLVLLFPTFFLASYIVGALLEDT